VARVNQQLAVVLLGLLAAAPAGAGQTLPVNTATSEFKELAVEVPYFTYVRTSAGSLGPAMQGPTRGAMPGPELTFMRGQESGSDVFVIDAQKSEPRRLVGGGAHPAWSRDGSKLAYCTWDDLGFGQIQVANADGTASRQITNMKGGACDPDWSPDGTKIAFTALSAGDSEKNLIEAKNTEIFVVDVNGGNPVPIASGYAARWSPAGTMLIFLRGPEKKGPNGSVWLASADGKQSKVVVASDRRVAGATWLPGARGIAFSAKSHERYSIFRVYLDGEGSQGNQPERIGGDDKANWTEPSVSPDGKYVIAVKDCSAGYGETNEQCSRSTIVLLDLETKTTVTLANGIQYSVIWEKK
jgi:Tol biopolymer transport system component